VPTNFPTALDTFPSAAVLAANTLNTDPHSALHGNLGDALAALEAKVGVDGSSVPSSLDYLLSLKAALASPTFTGTPSAPTATLGTNTTQLATTAFVLANAPALPADVARTGVANAFTTGPQTVAGTIRASGSTAPASGVGVEVLYTGVGVVQAYDRDNGVYKDLHLTGSGIFLDAPVFFTTGGLSISSTSTIAGIRLTSGDSFNTLWESDPGQDLAVTTNGGNLYLGAGVSKRYVTILSATGYVGIGNAVTPLAQLHIVAPGASVNGLIVEAAASATASLVRFRGQSSLQAREQADLDTAWVESTDATRKARVLLRAWDTAAREGLRIEADGAGPRIGFLGANAVARPTVTGSRGGNAALASLLNALALLGLITDSSTA
jgi:hypothetical protein